MKKGKISAADTQQALDLFAEGKSFEEIASELDRSAQSIEKLIGAIAEETVTELDAIEVSIETEDAAKTVAAIVEAVVEEVKLSSRPANLAKTANGKGGVAIATQASTEKVDSINKKLAAQKKPRLPGTYPIYKD